jgi:hypothetical protein
MAEDAEKYLSRFDSGMKEQEDYLVSEYMIMSKKEQDNGFIIKVGLDLYNKKIRDYGCMRVLIEAMVKGGYKEEKIKSFQQELETLYPERVIISA